MARAAGYSVAAVYAQQIVGAALGALGLFFVGREMPDGDAAYGLVAFGTGYAGLFLFITALAEGAHIRYASGAIDAPRWHATFAALKLATLAVYLLVGYAGVFAWTTLFGQGFASPDVRRAIDLFLLYFLLQGIGQITSVILRAEGRFGLSSMPWIVGHAVKAVAVVYSALNHLGMLSLSYAFVAGAATQALVALVLLPRYIHAWPDRTKLRPYLRFGVPATLGGVVSALLLNQDKLMIQLFLTQRHGGWYFAGFRFIELLQGLAHAVFAVLSRAVFISHARGERIEPAIGRALRIALLPLVPAVALLIGVPRAILHLFGDQFLPGAMPMAILASTVPLFLIRSVYNTALHAEIRLWEGVAVGATGFLLNGALNLLLIPEQLGPLELPGLGLTGAALATLASELAMTLLLLGVVRRIGFHPFAIGWAPAILQLALGAAEAVALTLLLPGLAWARFITVGALSTIMLALHLALAWKLGLTRDDRRWLRDHLPRRWRTA